MTRGGRLRNERGNILLFTTVLVVPFMLVMVGLAIDISYYGDVDAELQRSMDAAALAGVSKLGFSTEQFHDARVAASQYAQANDYRGGTVSLSLNEKAGGLNLDPVHGDIVLGVWDPATRTFSPSDNGNLVDSVQVRHSTTISTSFLKVIGITGLTAGAAAVAWAPPPAVPPTCPFPIGLTDAAFCSGGGGAVCPPGEVCTCPGAYGCGKPVRFISSSDESQIGSNTAGWANLQGCGTPNANVTRDAVNNAASGNCALPSLRMGDYLGTSGGLVNSAFTAIVNQFPPKYSASEAIDVFETDPQTGQQNAQPSYHGQGWSVVVPVVSASTSTGNCPSAFAPLRNTLFAAVWRQVVPWLCPSEAYAAAGGNGGGGGGNVNQNRPIVGWTKFVITQVIDQGDCVVNNPNDTHNAQLWPERSSASAPPCGTVPRGPGVSALREVYGYYACELFPTPGDAAGPAGARGKPKLVQ